MIQGTVVSRAGHRTAKEEGAAIREGRRREMMERDAVRQQMARMRELRGAAEGAESQLKDLIARHNRLAADVAGMREEAAETGMIDSGLAARVLELAEWPPIVEAARARARVARSAYDAALARQAAEAEAVVAEPQPATEPARGRGRPPKGDAR